jgi:hypothetical protein
MLYRVAVRLMDQREAAEGVLQEALLKWTRVCRPLEPGQELWACIALLAIHQGGIHGQSDSTAGG